MGALAIGIVGCGGFARGMHIPNLLADPRWSVGALFDSDPAQAEAAAQLRPGTRIATSLDDLLGDAALDAVLIATRHDSHAELTVRAARAGKHVLCEKPMGLNVGQCRAVAYAVRVAGVKYCVGYNRGMAPLVTRAKELLAPLRAPRLIYHRIQAPFPADHWTHDPAVGGGRFVGEGCHVFDLLCELAPAPATSVYAAGGTFLDPAKERIPDSAIVTIAFADGSVGTTLIASDGCATFPKESTEIYCAGRAVHIADFREIEWCGFDGIASRRESLPATDKGQAVEIARFAEAILGDLAPPNGVEQAARAAVLSYKVGESLASGLPVAVEPADYRF